MSFYSGGACTMVIHYVAGHKRLVAILGFSVVMALLVSPVGPGYQTGFQGTLEALQQDIQDTSNVLGQSDLNRASTQLADAATKGLSLTDDEIQSVLDSCNCRGVTIEDIREYPELERDVGTLFFFTLVHEQGLGAAESWLETSQTRQ